MENKNHNSMHFEEEGEEGEEGMEGEDMYYFTLSCSSGRTTVILTIAMQLLIAAIVVDFW